MSLCIHFFRAINEKYTFSFPSFCKPNKNIHHISLPFLPISKHPKENVFFFFFPRSLNFNHSLNVCWRHRDVPNSLFALKKWRFETMIAQPILKNSRVTQKTRFRAMVLAFLTSFIATPSYQYHRPTPSLSRQVSFFFRHFGLLILYDVLWFFLKILTL